MEQMGEELLPINRSRCLTVVAAVSVVAEWARGPRDKPRKGGHAARALPLGVWTGCMGTGGVWLCAVIKKKLLQSLWPLFLLCLRLPVSGLGGDAGLGRRLSVEPEFLVAYRFFFRSGGFNLFQVQCE